MKEGNNSIIVIIITVIIIIIIINYYYYYYSANYILLVGIPDGMFELRTLLRTPQCALLSVRLKRQGHFINEWLIIECGILLLDFVSSVSERAQVLHQLGR